jgi:hypothetical protein
MVFSGEYSDTDQVVSISQHTSALYVAAKDTTSWIELKLNGGPHVVWVPPSATDTSTYMCIPGDYVSFEVLTAGSKVVVYAVG